MACMASRCRGRKSEKPQTRWSAAASRRSASDVLALDVVIDQTLEVGGKLVVRPAQRGDMLAVDEHRAAGFLACARQADANAGGLRLARTVDHTAHDRQRHFFDTLVSRLPLGHPVADIALNSFGQLLERRARRA